MSVLSFLSADSTFCSDSMEDNIAHIRYDMAIMKQFQCIQTHGSHRYGSDGVCLYCGANGTDESAVLVDGATFNARVLEAMPNGGTATFVSSSTLVDEDTYPTTIDLSDADSIYTVYGHVNSEGTEMLIKADSYGLKANTNAASMFSGGTIAYSGLNLLDVSEVTDASNMFNGNTGIATAAELSGWDVSGITNMTSMFENCTLLTNISGLSSWVINNITNMSYMFKYCTALTDIIALSNWNVSNEVILYGMFYSVGVTDFSPLDSWNVTNEEYTTTNVVFDGNTELGIKPSWYTVHTIAILKTSTGMVSPFSTLSGYADCTSITAYTGDDTTTSKILSADDSEYIIYGKVVDNSINLYTLADTITIHNAYGLLAHFNNIPSFNNIDISNITNMAYMLYSANIVNLDGIDAFDTSNVTSMNQMFSNTAITDLTPLANWDVSNVTSMKQMFSGCTALTALSGLENWDVSSVTNMNQMFSNTAITDLTPLANWDTGNVTDMTKMFNKYSSTYSIGTITDLTPLANWDTGNVTSMSNMFYYNKNLADISALANWDTGNVTDMSYMFSVCEAISDISALAEWDVSNVTTFSSAFPDTCTTLPSWYSAA